MSDEPKTMDLAEKAFKTVLDADIHQDNKAGRILSAMAFLTAAAASIFSKVYSASLSSSEIQQKLTQSLSPILGAANQSVIGDLTTSLQKQHATLFGIDWALISFLSYILFVLVGASFYLAAIGPSFYIPSSTKQSDKPTTDKSLLFFKSIAKVSREQWEEYWKSPNLKAELENNFISETHLIAVKTQRKVDFMSLGNVLFKVAFIFLACLISSVFSNNLVLVRFIIILSTAFLTAALYVERRLALSKEVKDRNLSLIIAIWVLMIPVLVFIKLA